MTRNQILQEIQREHANFLAAIEGIAAEVIANESIAAEWTIKDMLGHIAMWMQVANKFIAEYQRDGMPKSLGLKDDAAVNAYNAQGWQARRGLALGQMREEFDAAYRDLIAAVEKLSDPELKAQLPEPWEKGTTLERLIAVNSYEHEPEHTAQIEEWRTSRNLNRVTSAKANT